MRNRFGIWLGIWLSFWIAFMVVFYAFMKLDIWLNPWLFNVVDQWKWYNFIISSHSIGALYIQYNLLWLVLFPLITLLFSGMVVFGWRAKRKKRLRK